MIYDILNMIFDIWSMTYDIFIKCAKQHLFSVYQRFKKTVFDCICHLFPLFCFVLFVLFCFVSEGLQISKFIVQHFMLLFRKHFCNNSSDFAAKNIKKIRRIVELPEFQL